MKTYFTFMKESHTLYHSSYTSAINAALQKHSDLNVSDEDRDTHIAMGPRKPAEGETVEHHIPATDKNGKRRIIHIQVYNKGGPTPYELNAYSSGDKVAEETVDVSEGLASTLGNVAKRALNVAKPVAIGAAKLTVKKVVKPAAKHVFNVVKHGVLRSILEDPTEMRHSSDSLGDHMALKAYTDKLGPKHIDRHDLLTAASHMAFGNMDHLKKHLKALDTDVRDKALEYVARRHHAELGYRVRKEEVDQIDELSLETMRSAKQKLAGRAKNAAMDDNKYLARREANRALNIGAKIKRKERQAATNEESDYIGYNFGGQFKDSSEWENAAKKRGLVVKLSTHPSGEVIKYQIAKDKSGNNRGHFDHGTKSGRLTEESKQIDEISKKQVYEEHMSEKDAERLAQKHVDAAISAKKSGNLAGYYAHAEASNYIFDKILAHTYSAKGVPSGKIRSTAKKLFGESSEHSINEAEYQGREVKLGKPTTGDVKKFKVYVKDPKTGNVKKVNFGDPNMEIKRDNPERRKNFRARHNCADKTDRTKAGYWSCRMWSSKPVSKIV